MQQDEVNQGVAVTSDQDHGHAQSQEGTRVDNPWPRASSEQQPALSQDSVLAVRLKP